MARSARKNLYVQPDVTRGMRSVYVERPTEIEIRIERRAHEIYCSRGQKDGHDFDDWLQAEEEILWD